MKSWCFHSWTDGPDWQSHKVCQFPRPPFTATLKLRPNTYVSGTHLYKRNTWCGSVYFGLAWPPLCKASRSSGRERGLVLVSAAPPGFAQPAAESLKGQYKNTQRDVKTLCVGVHISHYSSSFFSPLVKELWKGAAQRVWLNCLYFHRKLWCQQTGFITTSLSVHCAEVQVPLWIETSCDLRRKIKVFVFRWWWSSMRFVAQGHVCMPRN